MYGGEDLGEAKRKGVNLSNLAAVDLERMAAAGEEIRECYRVLEKANSNIVAEVIRGEGTFFEWTHYPDGDAVDWETHSQFYYHAHPKGERPGEHGHFHTFLRYSGIPVGLSSAPLKFPQAENEDRIGSHLFAVSMDANGFPFKLFTVNRWVTDETWYAAQDVATMLPRFEVDHTYPSWATNRWLSALAILFRPQIVGLLEQRDAAIASWADGNPETDVFEDRGLEVTSEKAISVDAQIAAVHSALKESRAS